MYLILLLAGNSIVLAAGYMGKPTGVLHTYLWRRLCGRSAGEVIQITSSEGYVNFEFLKITASTVFHQRFEPGTLGSENCLSKVGSKFSMIKAG